MIRYMPKLRLPHAVAVVGGLALAALTATALAAPAPVAPPAVTGATIYDSTLQCAPGQWAGAVGFTYAWMEGRSFVVATGPTYRTVPRDVNRTYYCRVTATDAAGATTTADSAPFRIGKRPLTFSFRLSSPSAGRVRVTGTAGPPSALQSPQRRAQVVLSRVLSANRFAQITIPPRTVPANGRVSFTVKDRPGRHRYSVRIIGPEFSLYQPFEQTRTITVKRRRR